MAPVECGCRSLSPQILKILRTAGGQGGSEEVRRAVIDVVAPRVCADQLKTVGKAAPQLECKTVVGRVSNRRVFDDGIVEAGGGELRQHIIGRNVPECSSKPS